ncbi:MAG: hypothetical protein LBK00_10215 [Treponema sp.]|jgi:hypothetical protein|nr:hypothetical protein [Treponema sp.]
MWRTDNPDYERLLFPDSVIAQLRGNVVFMMNFTSRPQTVGAGAAGRRLAHCLAHGSSAGKGCAAMVRTVEMMLTWFLGL